MTHEQRLKAFISKLKTQDEKTIIQAIEQDVGSLKEISVMFRQYKDKFRDQYADFCDDTKDAIKYLDNDSSYQGKKGYLFLWNFFRKPEVIADLELLVKGKERTWNDNDTNYMPIREALNEAKKKGRKISEPALSKKLTPNGQMRYMRKYTKEGRPYRCKVHIGDFRRHIKTLPLIDDPFSEEAFKARQEDIKNEKRHKGIVPEQDKGYNKLVKRILET